VSQGGHSELTLERREYKYLLPMSRANELRAGLAGVARLDPYAGPDGTYVIRSLYLDTGDLHLYHANSAEQGDRFKVRVRSYPGANAPIFLEVKRRAGDVIRKVRVKVPMDRWPSLLDTRDPDPREASFVDLVRRHDLRPTTFVEYRREAWMSELDDYARVTIDQEICAMPSNGWSLDPSGSGWRPIDHMMNTVTFEPVAVVELKFAGPAPIWMHRLVGRMELIRYAFSKYCNGVRSLLNPADRRDPSVAWGM
jgi:SPX domain protein involved in polyphosphate accumulation